MNVIAVAEGATLTAGEAVTDKAEVVPTRDHVAIEKGRHKIDRALVDLACSKVFHASIIMRLQREEWDGPFAMGTDGIRLLVNPEFCNQFSIAELVAILAHEALHVAGRHPLRRVGRQPTQWNIACDAVVNDMVGASGLKLPKDCVPAIPDETPEHLYAKPPKLLKQAMKDAKRWDEIFDPTGEGGRPLSKSELDQLDQETKQWVEAAASAAKRAGQLDAGLERFVKRELRSVVHWKEVLARFVMEKRLSDYSYARPNKRYTPFNIYLPRLEAKDIPRVAIACDTSGSISPVMIEQVVAEVIAILDMMADGEPIEVPVLWFDHAVYPQLVSDASELQVRGGGGTAYSPVMTWMTKHGIADGFTGLVVVTDGYCNDFGTQPPCEVLWVLTAENAGDSFQPPFGEVALVLEEHR